MSSYTAISLPWRRGQRIFLAASSPPSGPRSSLRRRSTSSRSPWLGCAQPVSSGSKRSRQRWSRLGLTPSSLAISVTVFEPRASSRRTASFLNESGRDFLFCIGGSPRRVVPFGVSTKAGQSQVSFPTPANPGHDHRLLDAQARSTRATRAPTWRTSTMHKRSTQPNGHGERYSCSAKMPNEYRGDETPLC
jgi:hypothetical protein